MHSEKLKKIIELQNNLFPNESLQERKSNFSEIYVEIGEELINKISDQLHPLAATFSIIKHA